MYLKCPFVYKTSAKALSLLIFLSLISTALIAPRSGAVSEEPAVPSAAKPPAANDGTKSRAAGAFGRLPLSFESNHGQAAAEVLFLARGQGYGLFLTADGAMFSFKGVPTPVRMRLQGAAATPRVSGVDQLPGKVNYLIGNQSDKWRTNISTFARVRYEQVYPGVDLVYYGNQQQLEYDFVVAPHASLKQIRLAFEGAGKLRLNARGDLVLKNGARQITLQRPTAYQEVAGERRSVRSNYLLKPNGEVGFQVGNYDKNLPLVIDPVLAYSTYLGGSGQDQGQSIAVDSLGNAYITGQTTSDNFPTASPLQAATGSSGITDLFVAKLNATGSALIYSTYLGGNNDDIATGIAVDGSGNAYVVGQTFSSNFPVANALHPTRNGFSDAFISELNAAGSALVYSTYLGGRSSDAAAAVAVDGLGNAYITGPTLSRDFPTTNPIQANRAGNSIFKTTNGAGNWAPSDSGLLAGTVNDLVFDPANSSIIYAVTDGGLFKSTDAGVNWNALSGQIAAPANKLVIDPTNTSIIYVAANDGMYKSTNGGTSFTQINNGFSIPFARSVAIDPVTPTTLYAVSVSNFVFKSIDGGANWVQGFINNVSLINGLVIDPLTPATLYAATNRGVFKSTNAGGTWNASSVGLPSFSNINSLALDKINDVLYAGFSNGIFKSVNGGANWTSIAGNLSLGFTVSIVTFDPSNSAVLYLALNSGTVQKTVNGGTTWNTSSTGYTNSTINSLVLNPAQPATLFIGTSSGADAFITKLSAGGGSHVYSTYLGGNLGDGGNSIAIDAGGNAYLAGSTNSTNFPTANALQTTKGALTDAFVTKLNAAGSALVYSTFLGGDLVDTGRAIAVDGSGNAYIGGTTSSTNFPVANVFQGTNAGINDAFVSKINAAGSAFIYSTYLGGSNNDDCADLAVDSLGSVYLIGSTSSTNFPLKGALQLTLAGISDAYVTKLTPSGSALVYSTYLGGASTETGSAIAVDSSQNAYVIGSTNSTNFPTAAPLQAATGGGFGDVFVAKLRSAPELALTITDSPDPVNFGANLTYTINVINNGDLAATNVVVSDTLPAGSTFVSANSTVGTCAGTSSINCTIGTMNPGASAAITIVIKPPAIRTVNNTATVTLTETDSFAANNTATAQTLVDFADLAITKNAAQSLVAPGGKLTYSLIATNKGVISAAVTVTDNLPAGTSLIKCAAIGTGVCGGAGNNVSVQIPSLAPGASEAVLLTVGVGGGVTAGTVISNTASVSSPIPDPDTSNNSATASVTVATVPLVPKSNGLIAFAADRAFTPVSEPSGIYTVKTDGTGELLFPNVPLNAFRPSWSPDGTKLAFQYTNHAGPSSPVEEIRIINANGSGMTTLVSNSPAFNRGITWSPNGAQIAFIGTTQPGNLATIRAINVANLDGSGSYQLPGSPTFLSAVDWSPDGSKFVYADDDEIFVMNADGTGQTQLTTTQQTNDGFTIDSEPHWSPDGTKILLTRKTTNSISIYMMNADGSNLGKLFNFGGEGADWSPDGSTVVAQVGNEICTANLDGSNFKCVTNNTYYEFEPSWQPLSATSGNTVQFAALSPSVAENAGFKEIVITRSGDLTNAATVNYATSDTAGLAACTVVNGKASERCDYETTVGTLRFAAGETSKSFLIPIIDDAHVEGNETFTITLSNPVGVTIAAPATTTFTIIDNDAAPSAQNPIDGVQFFVTQQYLDFLGRLPDSTGLANWMATLNGCPNGGFGENLNPDCDRVHVSAGFFLSDEFRGRGYWAYRFYEVGFDRRPLYAEFVPDMAQVGGPQSPASELLSKAAYTDEFVQRSEFVNHYGGLTNAAYVNALEQNAEITLSNKAAIVAALDGNQTTRAQVLRDIVESKAVEDRFFIRAFVAMQYFGYLRRDPDTVGYNNWVTTLTDDPANFRHMIFGFLFSTEYRGRFGAQ